MGMIIFKGERDLEVKGSLYRKIKWFLKESLKEIQLMLGILWVQKGIKTHSSVQMVSWKLDKANFKEIQAIPMIIWTKESQ